MKSTSGGVSKAVAMKAVSREWVMSAYAEGLPTAEHLKLRESTLALNPATIPDGHAAMQVLWVGVDPYLRSRMTGRIDGLYAKPYQLGQVIIAAGVGRIIMTKDAGFNEGDFVFCPFCPVAEYCMIPTAMLRKVDASTGVSLPEYLNSLGVAGFAAWVGMLLIGDPNPGENVFISAAAGGVGIIAGQLAKMRGCRVVGSTGTDDKVKYLKEELKFDDAFNYNKETNFDFALSKYFPSGIDIYLDNVGGKMLEAVLNHVNLRARIPLCGMISQYNQVWTDREGVRNMLNVVGKEVRMQGFMIGSYLEHFEDFAKQIEGLLKEGKLVSKITINNGIESFLESLVSVFSGSNVGKVVIKIHE